MAPYLLSSCSPHPQCPTWGSGYYASSVDRKQGTGKLKSGTGRQKRWQANESISDGSLCHPLLASGDMSHVTALSQRSAVRRWCPGSRRFATESRAAGWRQAKRSNCSPSSNKCTDEWISPCQPQTHSSVNGQRGRGRGRGRRGGITNWFSEHLKVWHSGARMWPRHHKNNNGRSLIFLFLLLRLVCWDEHLKTYLCSLTIHFAIHPNLNRIANCWLHLRCNAWQWNPLSITTW